MEKAFKVQVKALGRERQGFFWIAYFPRAAFNGIHVVKRVTACWPLKAEEVRL